MYEIIDNWVIWDFYIVNNFFVFKMDYYIKKDYWGDNYYSYKEQFEKEEEFVIEVMIIQDGVYYFSIILFFKEGFGFIVYLFNNLFFYYFEVQNCDFNDLLVNDWVEFCLGKNQEIGQDIVIDVYLQEDDEE